MRDCPQSTPPDPLLERNPPLHNPDLWEVFPVFRETFLMYITKGGFSTAFLIIGEMLYDFALEPPADWPEWKESATRTELRAAAADLRHLQGFLGSVGLERHTASLSPSDVRLSRFASDMARCVRRIANAIEHRLDKEAGKP